MAFIRRSKRHEVRAARAITTGLRLFRTHPRRSDSSETPTIVPPVCNRSCRPIFTILEPRNPMIHGPRNRLERSAPQNQTPTFTEKRLSR
jgi:hypothetical protein